VLHVLIDEVSVFTPKVTIRQRIGVDGAIQAHRIRLLVQVGLDFDLGRDLNIKN
jgi:hypothetical protein